MRFVQAKQYAKGPRRGGIDLIVIHDMESAERLNTAEEVASYFARITRPASAHYNVDGDTIVQSVKDGDIAYHAAGANHNGIGIEHAGYAKQTRAEWLDPYGQRMLALSAKLVADLCAKYKIPVQYVDAAGLKAGRRGITTHHQVNTAFKRGHHWDPGPNFPMTEYLAMVRGGGAAAKQVEEDDFDVRSDTDIVKLVQRGITAAGAISGQKDFKGTLEAMAAALRQIQKDVAELKAKVK